MTYEQIEALVGIPRLGLGARFAGPRAGGVVHRGGWRTARALA